MRGRIGFVLLIVATAAAAGWGFERYIDHRSSFYASRERIVPVRYTNYYFKGGGFEAGAVPESFCAPASKAIPATAHIVASIGETAQTSGSGTIISEDGYIVTNHHVVDGADYIQVTLNNRKVLRARLVGSDPGADLAVLKVDAEGLPFLLWGNSNDVKVGQWVLAVGYPFSLETTVTAGIISAKGQGLVPRGPARPGLVDRRTDPGEAFIQTDAAVNFGNSGGPLVDLSGEVVGIVTAMATPTGVYTGYSFAIPGNVAERTVKEIIRNGGIR
ncbi:MAG TPA: trypsin-like peptidase domain-containing protein [Puia sp.]|nr:trypsin-like peptidase domain-containing protein [Puia sp.]